jgi:hypothetical protein
VDITNNIRSPSFTIGAEVYKPILKQALRTFFYQRAGLAKSLPFAEAAWVDGASHIGAGQDKNARLFNDAGNAVKEKDLSGGWYDAGDYNKYTSWAADYVITLLHAYLENPAAWGDDFSIPESGNGIPDIIDEIKWGLDWLIKMQNATGDNSVLSIVSLSHASPPSAAKGASYYGPATTNASMSSAAAFALASKVFKDSGISSLVNSSEDLKNRAEGAWAWAVANPDIIFKNNDTASGSKDIGAGQQEPLLSNGSPDLTARATKKRIAAVYMFAATGKDVYKNHIETEYTKADLKTFADSYRELENTSLLYYANLPNTTESVTTSIKNWFKKAMESSDNWNAMPASSTTQSRDPYLAFINHYGWGSNSTKSAKGSMFMNINHYAVAGFDSQQAKNHALTYVNYLHGVNPQGIVYLSNMYNSGAHYSVNEFYHTWFTNGSSSWDRVTTTTPGPAPGFLVGGPNPDYDWDSFCVNTPSDSRCEGNTAPTPPKGQPKQKAYKDFNTSWPLNSWSVTENSCGYQANYLRLLSKFVN